MTKMNMMKKTLGLALLSLISVSVSAQQNEWCGTDAHNEALRAMYPEAAAKYDELSEQQRLIAQNGAVKREEEKIIIPTVVHVMYDDCEGNITKEQVIDGLRVLNEDMQRLNGDSNDTRSMFLPYVDRANIEFRLAQLDPQGNQTDGIERIQTPYATSANDNNVKNITGWPSDEYFNIWVVEAINFGGSGTVLGYAQFPNVGPWSTYGIVIRNDAMGTIGTSTADGRTLTHEVGHCLNLYHTFQGGCGWSCSNSGDYVCDTPPTSAASWSCDFGYNTCSNDNGSGSPYPSGTPDMIENYMSYNDCQNLFTEGQVDRMLAVFNVHSRLEDLVSEQNLIQTGVAGMIAADFTTEADVVVTGRKAKFIDETRYGATEWEWDFGASTFPPTSNEESPEPVFIETGLMPVTLNASDGTTDVTVTKDVFVVSPIGHYVPYEESFEAIGSLPSNQWVTVNRDDDDREFLVTTNSAFSGNQSLMVENSDECGEFVDELISQTYDFSNFQDVQMTFKVAYAQRNASNTDFLRVSTSDDYGQSWQIAWIRSGAGLSSTTYKAGTWYPTNESDWNEFTINFFQSALLKEGILIKFEFAATGGNNFFIDDIAFDGTFTGDLLLRSPQNGKGGLPEDVLIDWKAVGEADFYEYQIDASSDFSSSGLITGTNDFIDNTGDNEDTEFLAEGLDHDTKYYWRVRYDNGGTLSDWSDTWSFNISEDGVGIDEESISNAISVYPNPTTGSVTLRSSNQKLTSVKVIDLSGRLVHVTNESATATMQLDLSNLQRGLYMLQVETQAGELAIKTLMIQ